MQVCVCHHLARNNWSCSCNSNVMRTWLASSLVGEMITALKPRLAGCCRWASSGRQKAKVFPDPVGAQASSSRPWSTNQTHRKSSQNRHLYAGHRKLRVCVRTHMHHERYRLHLHWRRGVQPSVSEVLDDTRVEAILRLQLLKCAHGVGYVGAVHVYPVLRTNAIHLNPNKNQWHYL